MTSPVAARRQINLAEVLEAHAFGILGSVYKIWPGTVTAYHASTAGKSPPLVDVQPGVNDLRLDPVLGTTLSEPWPVMRVPLAVLQLGPFAIAAQATPGTEVTLLSYDMDPTAFRTTGEQSNPIDTGRHKGGHWIALPFSLTNPSGLADPGSNLVLGQPGGVQIQINGSNIVLGSGATDFVALASLVKGELTKIATAFSTFVPGSGGASFPQPYTTAGNVASSLVQSK